MRGARFAVMVTAVVGVAATHLFQLVGGWVWAETGRGFYSIRGLWLGATIVLLVAAGLGSVVAGAGSRRLPEASWSARRCAAAAGAAAYVLVNALWMIAGGVTMAWTTALGGGGIAWLGATIALGSRR